MGYSGHEWIQRQGYCNGNMSMLGEEVADLLGDVFRGIYHLNRTSLGKVDWSHDCWIQVTVDRELANVDMNELTILVVLAHDRLMRVSVAGLAPRFLSLGFSKRKSRVGPAHARCPAIEDHIEQIRAHYGYPG